MNGVYISFKNPNIHAIWPLGAVEEERKRVFGIPKGKRAFEYLFEPIFDILAPLYWYTAGWQSTPFVQLSHQPGGEEVLDSLRVDVPSAMRHNGNVSLGVALYKPGILPRFAGYLYDDWMKMTGLPASTDEEALAIANRFVEQDWRDAAQAEFYELVESVSPCSFFCIDGQSWEVYAKDQQVLDRVYLAAHGRPGLEVKPCILQRRDNDFGW